MKKKPVQKKIEAFGIYRNPYIKSMKEETMSEIVNEPIIIPCYLCGKGNIIIRRGDITLHSPHPLDAKIKADLQQFLTKKVADYFKKIEKHL